MLSKLKNRIQKSAQITVLFMVILSMLMLYVLIAMEMGQLSIKKYSMDVTVDTTALSVASQFASQAKQLSDQHLDGNIKRTIGHGFWSSVFGKILAWIIIIVAIVVAIVVAVIAGIASVGTASAPIGVGGALAIIALAGAIGAVGSYMLSKSEMDTEMIEAWADAIASIDNPASQARETALMPMFLSMSADMAKLRDVHDFNRNTSKFDEVSRPFYWYSVRMQDMLTLDDGYRIASEDETLQGHFKNLVTALLDLREELWGDGETMQSGSIRNYLNGSLWGYLSRLSQGGLTSSERTALIAAINDFNSWYYRKSECYKITIGWENGDTETQTTNIPADMKYYYNYTRSNSQADITRQVSVSKQVTRPVEIEVPDHVNGGTTTITVNRTFTVNGVKTFHYAFVEFQDTVIWQSSNGTNITMGVVESWLNDSLEIAQKVIDYETGLMGQVTPDKSFHFVHEQYNVDLDDQSGGTQPGTALVAEKFYDGLDFRPTNYDQCCTGANCSPNATLTQIRSGDKEDKNDCYPHAPDGVRMDRHMFGAFMMQHVLRERALVNSNSSWASPGAWKDEQLRVIKEYRENSTYDSLAIQDICTASAVANYIPTGDQTEENADYDSCDGSKSCKLYFACRNYLNSLNSPYNYPSGLSELIYMIHTTSYPGNILRKIDTVLLEYLSLDSSALIPDGSDYNNPNSYSEDDIRLLLRRRMRDRYSWITGLIWDRIFTDEELEGSAPTAVPITDQKAIFDRRKQSIVTISDRIYAWLKYIKQALNGTVAANKEGSGFNNTVTLPSDFASLINGLTLQEYQNYSKEGDNKESFEQSAQTLYNSLSTLKDRLEEYKDSISTRAEQIQTYMDDLNEALVRVKTYAFAIRKYEIPKSSFDIGQFLYVWQDEEDYSGDMQGRMHMTYGSVQGNESGGYYEDGRVQSATKIHVPLLMVDERFDDDGWGEAETHLWLVPYSTGDGGTGNRIQNWLRVARFDEPRTILGWPTFTKMDSGDNSYYYGTSIPWVGQDTFETKAGGTLMNTINNPLGEKINYEPIVKTNLPVSQRGHLKTRLKAFMQAKAWNTILRYGSDYGDTEWKKLGRGVLLQAYPQVTSSDKRTDNQKAEHKFFNEVRDFLYDNAIWSKSRLAVQHTGESGHWQIDIDQVGSDHRMYEEGDTGPEEALDAEE